MNRALKLWNGRGYCIQLHNVEPWKSAEGKSNRPYGHLFIAAYSRADAVQMMLAYLRGKAGDHCTSESSLHYEIKKYFSHGCWGTSMSDVTPERGIWVIFDHRRIRHRLV